MCKKFRSYNRWSQLIDMTISQLAALKSLRDIQGTQLNNLACLRSYFPNNLEKQYEWKRFNLLGCNLTFCFVLASIIVFYPGKYAQSEFKEWKLLSQTDKNNTKCVDLTDLDGSMPLTSYEIKQVLRRSEEWEFSNWDDGSRDSLGFPSVVKNIYGSEPDNKYYLFYAHHDPNSGIGCAIADKIDGPYTKISDLDKNRKDSQVLQPLSLLQKGKNLVRKLPYHYSSPCVLWDEDKQLWVMFFHYYKNEFKQGNGHQKTGVATCTDLKTNKWKIKRDEKGNIVPIFPTTSKRWMNSQSSYHAIQRLPDGTWLAFLRGTGGEYNTNGKWIQDTTKLGFAISSESLNSWEYAPDNPIITQANTGGGRKGVLRPSFIGYLGGSKFLVAWSESKYYDSDPRIIYNVTTDFREFERDSRGYAEWLPSDGLVSPWREGDKLYLFTGKNIYIFNLLLRVEALAGK